MKIEIYMKSGNVIKLDGIEDIEVKGQGDVIKFIEIVKEEPLPKRSLMLSSLDFSQVEAVVLDDEK